MVLKKLNNDNDILDGLPGRREFRGAAGSKCFIYLWIFYRHWDHKLKKTRVISTQSILTTHLK